MSTVAPSQLLLETGGTDYILLEDGSALLREDIRIVAVTAANPRSTTGTTLTITIPATEAGTDLLISLLNDTGASIVSVVGNLNAGTLTIWKSSNDAHNSVEIRKLSGLTVGTTVLTVTWNISCSSNGQVVEVEGL